MKDALRSAGIGPDAVDYINAHATGTLLGDLAEAEAISEVFGQKKIPVSSLKGHMGHTLGASGALELAASIRMIHARKLIPTLNLKRPGEGCDGISHVNGSGNSIVNTVVKNSFAFGGINTVLILRRYDKAHV
jgi:3-oxoacyl-[acyl-carrier-protein] synthase II